MRPSTIAVSVLLALLAALTATIEAFLVPIDPIPGVSIAAVIAAVVNYLLAVEGRRSSGHTLGAALPGLVWLVVVVYLGSGRREGDLVVPGDAAGLGFMLIGALGAAVGIGRRPRARPGDPTDDQTDTLQDPQT